MILLLLLAVLVSPILSQGDATGNAICLDLIFVVDVSCSISPSQLADVKLAMLDIVRNAELQLGDGEDPKDTKIAALSYSLGYRDGFFLETYSTLADIESAIFNFNVTAEGCRTHTFAALKAVSEVYLDLNQNGNRLETPDVAIVFADGVTYPRKKQRKTIKYAKILQEMGVEIFVFRLDNIPDIASPEEQLQELQQIASPPYDKHIFNFSEPNQVSEDFFANAPRDCTEDIPCREVADVVLVLDRSLSIDAVNDLPLVVNFYVELASQFAINPEEVMFAAISYNKQPELHFTFADHHTRLETINWIKLGIPLTTAKGTRTDLALELARDTIINDARPTSRKMVFLASDGNTVPVRYRDNTLAVAQEMKDLGYEMFVIRLPNSNDKTDGPKEELEKIASQPLDRYYFDSATFDDLEQLVAPIVASACRPVVS